VIGLVELALLAFALTGMATWIGVVVFAPGGVLRRKASPKNAASASAWLYAPLWVPLLLLLGAVLPKLVGALLNLSDHCLLHGSHHHHFCLLHPPHTAGHLMTWVVPIVLLLPALTALSAGLRRVVAQGRLLKALVGTSRPSSLGEDVRIVERSEPLALTTGLKRPVVLLSSGLVKALDPLSLRVVVAHERAHIARWDTRRAAVAQLMSTLLPARVGGLLVAAIALEREAACDAAAARKIGSRPEVARALTAVARLRIAAPAHAVSVASGSLPARVHRLLDAADASSSRYPFWPGTAILVVALGASPMHHALEHLVSILVH